MNKWEDYAAAPPSEHEWLRAEEARDRNAAQRAHLRDRGTNGDSPAPSPAPPPALPEVTLQQRIHAIAPPPPAPKAPQRKRTRRTATEAQAAAIAADRNHQPARKPGPDEELTRRLTTLLRVYTCGAVIEAVWATDRALFEARKAAAAAKLEPECTCRRAGDTDDASDCAAHRGQ